MGEVSESDLTRERIVGGFGGVGPDMEYPDGDCVLPQRLVELAMNRGGSFDESFGDEPTIAYSNVVCSGRPVGLF